MRSHSMIAAVAMALLLVPFAIGAQQIDNDHTAREEAQGRALASEIQRGVRTCASLSDQEFGALGEYAMGLMVGEGHAAMNAMMTRMMGEDGEEAMHVVLGKRWSGCNSDASYPSVSWGAFPMMGMMGGWGGPRGTGSTWWGSGMMGSGSWWWVGGLVMVLWWIFAFILVLALIRWLLRHTGDRRGRKPSARDILDERYAVGKITKAEYDEKRNDLDRSLS